MGSGAIISGIDAQSVNVFVSEYCMERRIYLDKAKEEWQFDAETLVLTKTTPPSKRYRIFDKVQVKIYVFTSRHHRKKLVVEIVDGGLKDKGDVADVEIPTSNQIM